MPSSPPISSRLLAWLVAALIPAFAMWPALAVPVEEHTYDAASFHILRALVFSDAQAGGVWFPRWAMPINGGLGGPLFAYYPPLSYFLMGGLHALGLPLTLAWRVLIAAALLIGSLGMFGLGLALWRRAEVAWLACAGFVYAPTLLRDLLERGSPQGLALALIPLSLWLLLRLGQRPSGLRLLLAASGWAAVILMHNLTALMALPVMGIMLFFKGKPSGGSSENREPSSEGWIVAALALGVLLAMPHVLPYVFERDWVQLDRAAAERFTGLTPESLPLADLLAPPPMMDTGLENNDLGYGVGWAQIGLIALGLISLPRLWRSDRWAAGRVGLTGLLALLVILLRTPMGDAFWQAAPALATFGLRWRPLALTGLIAALCGGEGMAALNPHPASPLQGGGQMQPSGGRWGWSLPLTALTIALSLPLTYPQNLHQYIAFPPDLRVADLPALAAQVNAPDLSLTAFGEFVPRWRGMGFPAAPPTSLIGGLPPGAQVLDQQVGKDHFRLDLDSPAAFTGVIQQLYFPGWAAQIDGVGVGITPQPASGLMLIALPAGRHRLTLTYVGTPAGQAGDWIGGLALIGLVITACLWRSPPPVLPLTRGRWPEAGGDSLLLARGRWPEAGGDSLLLTRGRWPEAGGGWLALGLIGLILIKGLWIDPYTSLLRSASTCDQVSGARPVDVVFGGEIRLCAVRLDRLEYHPGQSLSVSLFWQIDGRVDQSAYAYVHLLGEAFNPLTNNPIWGQQDKQLPGRQPLFEWLAGRLYRDVYTFDIPAITPPGEYLLEAGWYRPEGSRLMPVIQGGEGIELTPYQSISVAVIRVR
jgi:hypothetical protein